MRKLHGKHPLTFHTLGASSYIDIDKTSYHRNRRATAATMLDRFKSLYIKVCDGISGVTRQPSMISKQLAPPGFHILNGSPLIGEGIQFGGTIHCDLPHIQHRDIFGKIDDILSFTLPISLPEGGGGMFFWTKETDMNLMGPVADKGDRESRWLEENKKIVSYTPGEMILHDGKTPHQMASLCRTSAKDWRITLQGHGIFSGGVWELYF